MFEFFYYQFSFVFSVTWLSVIRLEMRLLCWFQSKSLLCLTEREKANSLLLCHLESDGPVMIALGGQKVVKYIEMLNLF